MISWHFPPLVKKDPSVKDFVGWVADSLHAKRVKLAQGGMDKDRRQFAVEDLSKRTPTTVINGQRHYLLHRVINDPEVKNVSNDSFNNTNRKVRIGKRYFPSVTSWTSNPLQISFRRRNHLVSAWIPESHVSFYPIAYKHLNQLSALIDREQEVIVKPGKFSLVHHSVRSQPQDVSDYWFAHRHGSELADKEGLKFDPHWQAAKLFS